jgi:hypothetical protein
MFRRTNWTILQAIIIRFAQIRSGRAFLSVVARMTASRLNTLMLCE